MGDMKITIEIPDALAKELNIIVETVGLGTPELLLKKYVREVILAARSDAAANQAKQQTLAASSDLDTLIETDV